MAYEKIDKNLNINFAKYEHIVIKKQQFLRSRWVLFIHAIEPTASTYLSRLFLRQQTH